MTAQLPADFLAPFDASPDEVETRAELDVHLARGSLDGLVLQGLRLDVDPPDLTGVSIAGTLFMGCHFASTEVAADLVRRGADVVPAFRSVPYPTHPPALYTPADLAAGFSTGGFEAMYDTVVYRHFLEHNAAVPDLREAVAQRMHDHAMDDALDELISAWVADFGFSRAVGMMGGHAVKRGSASYRLAASLAWRLTRRDRLIVTGGGPGVMEAANLGSFLSGRTEEELTAAIDMLARYPDFRDHTAYTGAALEVRQTFAAPDEVPWSRRGGLSIPTWLYGHEPANLFAAQIAKYFSNAIREDTILRLCRGGIVFAEGQAGTVQEIFQAVTKTFYSTDGESGPYVFVGKDYWMKDLPVQTLLSSLLTACRDGDRSGLIAFTDDPAEATEILCGGSEHVESRA